MLSWSVHCRHRRHRHRSSGMGILSGNERMNLMDDRERLRRLLRIDSRMTIKKRRVRWTLFGRGESLLRLCLRRRLLYSRHGQKNGWMMLYAAMCLSRRSLHQGKHSEWLSRYQRMLRLWPVHPPFRQAVHGRRSLHSTQAADKQLNNTRAMHSAASGDCVVSADLRVRLSTSGRAGSVKQKSLQALAPQCARLAPSEDGTVTSGKKVVCSRATLGGCPSGENFT